MTISLYFTHTHSLLGTYNHDEETHFTRSVAMIKEPGGNALVTPDTLFPEHVKILLVYHNSSTQTFHPSKNEPKSKIQNIVSGCQCIIKTISTIIVLTKTVTFLFSTLLGIEVLAILFCP